VPLILPLLLAVALFCIGVYGVLARRNAITMLMSFELMLNAVNLNLVAFDAWHLDGLANGQTLAVFVITLAAAEIGLGLAIILLLFRGHGTVDADAARDLVEQERAS
jgi:NADH-quinone oxidoreductase subunit K